MPVDIHFQLDEENPEGHQALAVLATWEQQGYPVDEVLLRALIVLGERQQSNQASSTVVYVKDIIRQMRDLLGEIRSLRIVAPVAPAEAETPIPPQEDTAQLSQAFLNAVKKAARPGLRLDS
jgi:hypothetical protein